MAALKQYERAFNAMGDPTRRYILEKLVNGPSSVVDIARGMKVTRPAVSQHLKVLREAKLIEMKQEGTRCIYRVHREGLLLLRNYLDHFWDEALVNFKKVAEGSDNQKK